MAPTRDQESTSRSTVVPALFDRFTSADRRFRLAISCGFAVVAVGWLVVGHGTRYSDAQSFWGGMDLTPFLGGQQPAAQPNVPSPQYAQRPAHMSKPRHRLAGSERGKLAFVRAEGNASEKGARRSMCVRLCDGFVFPVGDYHGEGDRAAHEATCQSECPGAKTALFVVPQSSDAIADANDARTGRNYSQLPDAFHYTTYLQGSCSCHPAGGNRVKSLLRDFTLRRGDAIMTRAGIRIFHGDGSFPFKRKDFVALAKSQDVRKIDRASLKAIERASIGEPTTVAETRAPTVAARLERTRSLEHQAQN